MKEHPILFSKEMTQAILDGRKTQTRMPVEPQPREIMRAGQVMIGHSDLCGEFAKHVFGSCFSKLVECPYGKPGDRLWVQEPWRDDFPFEGEILSRDPWVEMPRWASRITLEITDVRVERVQKISEDDAMAEGCSPPALHSGIDLSGNPIENPGCDLAPSDIFMDLWNSLWEKKGFGWSTNCWVWVREFKVVEGE